MKKIFNITTSALLLVMLTAMQLCFTSCKESSSSSGEPVITCVRVCDPDKADSTFTKSSQGQIIAIMGQNLDNTIYVYINDQKVYFNPTMNTDHSIIVTVPTEAKGFKLTAFNSDLKDEIRVETSHGTATYNFKILGASPSISRIQCDYPREAGDSLNIYGMNLEAIEKVLFTDLSSATLDTTKWTEVGGNVVEVPTSAYRYIVNDHHLNTKTNNYETTSQLRLAIPQLSYESGTFVIQCAAGNAYIPYSKYPGQPVITSISSDMPVVGEEVTISGREFVQVSSIKYGDVTLTTDQFKVAESEDAITFDFSQVPSAGSDPTLSITTPGGTVSETFYDREFLFSDFDDADSYANMGWDPNVEFLTQAPYGGTGTVAHFNTFGQWWGQMLFFSHDWNFTSFTLPSYDKIPKDAMADDVYLAFEVYDNNSDFNNGGAGYQGFLRVSLWGAANNSTGNQPDVMFHNFSWDNYDEGTFVNPYGPILQDISHEAHKGRWYRSVIRLSDFGLTDSEGNLVDPFAQAYVTYGDFVNRGVSILRFMSYTQGTKSGNVDVYVDNVRLYYNKN